MPPMMSTQVKPPENCSTCCANCGAIAAEYCGGTLCAGPWGGSCGPSGTGAAEELAACAVAADPDRHGACIIGNLKKHSQ